MTKRSGWLTQVAVEFANNVDQLREDFMREHGAKFSEGREADWTEFLREAWERHFASAQASKPEE